MDTCRRRCRRHGAGSHALFTTLGYCSFVSAEALPMLFLSVACLRPGCEGAFVRLCAHPVLRLSASFSATFQTLRRQITYTRSRNDSNPWRPSSSRVSPKKPDKRAVWMLLGTSDPPIIFRTPFQVVMAYLHRPPYLPGPICLFFYPSV